MNILIEGLPGMGKSTLLQKLSQKYPQYHAYREGDYCPIELSWCSYMSPEEYEAAIHTYPSVKEDIERWTTREGDRYVVAYTRIITDEPGFHKYMEQFEIYNGRKTAEEFKHIILERYRNFSADHAWNYEVGDHNAGNLFECAFFQNIIEELLLFCRMTDEEICSFYRELFAIVTKEDFRLYYLYNENIEEILDHICKERSDEQGNQLWYQLMLSFLRESPYGKAHGLQDFQGMLAHFKHRQKLELRIIREILGDCVTILPAKKYTDEDLTI